MFNSHQKSIKLTHIINKQNRDVMNVHKYN